MEGTQAAECNMFTTTSGVFLGLFLLAVLALIALALWIKKVQRSEKERSNLVHELDRRLEELNHAYGQERSAKESALARLSKMASEKIRDGNPDIADLSDTNRPTKLGEQMAELYDTPYTEAMAWLESTYGENERKHIDLLLNVLMDTYRTCQDKAAEQLRIFIDPFGSNEPIVGASAQKSSLPGGKIPFAIKDARKKIGKASLKMIMRGILEILKQREEYKAYLSTEDGPFHTFVTKCAELCWLMCIQDPPVALDTGVVGEKFDSSRYRPYTRSGSTVAFIVWPMVKLHDNGPLLSKGIAQGGPKEERIVDVSN